MNTAAMKLGG